MRMQYIPALLLIGAAPAAQAVTVAYTYDSAGDGIELTQNGFLASGFTFANKCSNQQIISAFRIKAGNGDESWGITEPSGSATAVEAMVIDETKRTWALYFEDSSYGIPWEVVNEGNLTKVKAC